MSGRLNFSRAADHVVVALLGERGRAPILCKTGSLYSCLLGCYATQKSGYRYVMSQKTAVKETHCFKMWSLPLKFLLEWNHVSKKDCPTRIVNFSPIL